MASEGLFSGCWTPATLQTFQVPPEGTQLKVRPFGTRVGTLADLKISKACWNIYRRISSGGVIAWHGRHELRDTTGLPFASLTRIDIPVRSNARWLNRLGTDRGVSAGGACCGQECPMPLGIRMVFGELFPRSSPGAFEFGDIFLEGANGARFGGAPFAAFGQTSLGDPTQ